MNVTVRPVTFANGAGCRLTGMLHEPAERRSDLAVVLLAAGVKARVGPHGLYTRLASSLADSGFAVLRFDFWGLGDSEGTAAEPLLADLYGSVSCGRYVADTRAAVTWIRESLHVDRVILAGLCGGAITGLLAGAGDARVAGLLSLGMPITVDGSNIDKVKYMSQGQLRGIRQRYLAKLTEPRAWTRVLTLRTDFRLLWRAMSFGLPRRSPTAGEAAPDVQVEDNTNPYFRPAFLAMLQAKQPVLMVFSEADRLYSEFRERFIDRYRFEPRDHLETLDVELVADANHVFTFQEWQVELLAVVQAWLQRRFPIRDAATADAAPVQARR